MESAQFIADQGGVFIPPVDPDLIPLIGSFNDDHHLNFIGALNSIQVSRQAIYPKSALPQTHLPGERIIMAVTSLLFL